MLKYADLSRILSLLPRARRRMAFWAGSGIVLGALEVLTMGLLVVTVSTAVGTSSEAAAGRIAQVAALFPSRSVFLDTVLVALLAAAAAKYLFGLWVERRNTRIVFDVAAGVQKRVYRNLLHARFGVFSEHRHGTLTNAVVSMPFRAFQGIVFLPRAVLSLATILFMSAFLMLLSPGVFLGAAVVAALYFLAVRLFVQRVVFDTNVQRHESIQRHSEIVSEGMSGIRQIRIFGGEDETLDEFGAEADRYATNTAKETYIKIVPNVTVQFIFVAALSAGLLVANHTMSADRFVSLAPLLVTYVYGAMRILPAVGIFNEANLSMVASLPHISALQEWLDVEPDGLGLPGAESVPRVERGIAFRDVGFWFEDGRWVVRHLDMELPAGTVTALVGPSGSGKSTIIDLLLKLIAPKEGSIVVDGEHDLASLDRSAWFGLIGFVSQDTFLFHSSIRENLLYANAGAAEADLWRALEQAGAREFVESLPRGLDTELGDRGVTVSGGQRQRLAIARALVRGPSILLLDEATSALDERTEAQVLDTLFELAEGRTVLLVAHKMSIVERADRVVLLGDGKVRAVGTYAELASAGLVRGEVGG